MTRVPQAYGACIKTKRRYTTARGGRMAVCTLLVWGTNAGNTWSGMWMYTHTRMIRII